MCVTICSHIQHSSHDIIAYKVVRPTSHPDVFLSEYPHVRKIRIPQGLPEWRTKPYTHCADGFAGRELTYKLGVPTHSPLAHTPGIYLYRESRAEPNMLEVLIPRHTSYFFSFWLGSPTINAAVIIPQRTLPREYS